MIWLDERPMLWPWVVSSLRSFAARSSRFAAAVWFVAHDVEGGDGGGGDGGREGGGEDVGAGAVHEPIDQAAAAGDETAGAAEGFAERAHADVDAVFDAEMFGDAAAVRAENAGGVGFVDHQHGGMLFGKFGDFRQRRKVAVHAEQRIGHDQAAAVAR